MREIERLQSLIQKIIKKYQPNCEQKTVDFSEEHPDYFLWITLIRDAECKNIRYGCYKNKVLLIHMIIHFLKHFRSEIKDKKLSLIVWRGAGPMLNYDPIQNQYLIGARWDQV